ncbi:MAG TPA: LOG family protein, partial [Pirellulales bacterium]
MSGAESVRPDVRAIMDSPSYELAERDLKFLARPELRPVRVQLELLKPELAFVEQQVRSTIVLFGGTQIWEPAAAAERLRAAEAALAAAPDDARLARLADRARRLSDKSKYYDAARQFSALVSEKGQSQTVDRQYVIMTGGGPGIMEAGNRGAHDVGAKSIGLNIKLPEEQASNAFVTPGLGFSFHYFAMRKFHFLLRAQALVVFPGGFGTLDELFEAITLVQTGKISQFPVILFGTHYWAGLLRWMQARVLGE